MTNVIKLLVGILYLNLTFGFRSPRSGAYSWTQRSNPTHWTMLIDDNRNDESRKRIISPDDLSSLFGRTSNNPVTSGRKLIPSNVDRDDDFDDEHNDDDSADIQGDDEDGDAYEDRLYQKSVNESNDRKAKNTKRIERELDLLDSMASSSSSLALVGQDPWEELMLDGTAEFEYADLNRPLDKSTQKKVLDALTVAKYSSNSMSTVTPSNNRISTPVVAGSSSSTGDARVVKYNPKEFNRGDPMQYGAYRRWKVGESDNGKVSKSKVPPGKRKTAKPKNAAEKFYDAIKNLGSGPSAPGSGRSTGVADPPPNKSPIQPKKAPSGKKRKRVITSDEINDLFDNNVKKSKEDSDDDIVTDDDDEEDEADDDDDIGSDIKKDDEFKFFGKSKDVPASDDADLTSKDPPSSQSFLQPLASDEIPQWLDDADKAEKKRRSNLKKNKRKKKLTDDWRFWIAIITSVGFATAFYTMNQQTGGFGASATFVQGGGPEVVI